MIQKRQDHRHSNSFTDDEVDVLDAIIKAVMRIAALLPFVRHAGFVGAARKVQAMKRRRDERALPNGQQEEQAAQ